MKRILIWALALTLFLNSPHCYGAEPLASNTSAPAIELKKIGKKQIQISLQASTEMELSYASEIISNVPAYSGWLLRGINKREGGKEFKTDILGIDTSPDKPNQLTVTTKMKFPFMNGVKKLQYNLQFQREGEAFLASFENLPTDDSMIEGIRGSCRFIPKAEPSLQVSIRCEAVATLRSGFVYSMIPAGKKMKSEVVERAKIFRANYRAEENRLRGEAKIPIKDAETKNRYGTK